MRNLLLALLVMVGCQRKPETSRRTCTQFACTSDIDPIFYWMLFYQDSPFSPRGPIPTSYSYLSYVDYTDPLPVEEEEETPTTTSAPSNSSSTDEEEEEEEEEEQSTYSSSPSSVEEEEESSSYSSFSEDEE